MELDPNRRSKAGDSPAMEPNPRCPHCGWQDVMQSHARTSLDRALSVFSIARFRCRTCHHRFYRFHKRRVV